MPVIFDDAHILKKTVQLGVRFTPMIDSVQDRPVLEQFAQQVRTTDPRLFNRYSFGKPTANSMQSVLLFERDILLKGIGQAHHTPLVVYPSFLELALIYRMPEARGVEIDGIDRPRDEDFTKLVRPVMRQFWEKVNIVDVNHIGKVYEYIYGPYEGALDWMNEHVIRAPHLEGYTSSQVIFMFRQEGYNINLNISHGQSPFGEVLQVRLDINNADLTQKLQISDLDTTLAFATKFHTERFAKLLKGG